MPKTPTNQGPSSQLLDVLMKDPIKRTLILELLSKESHNFEAYKRQEEKKAKAVCNSPSALFRKRALEKLNKDTSDSSSSEISEVRSEDLGPKLPMDELLKGVTAYVEVKKNDEDRSEGIKAVTKMMGATVRDTFTNDVTHVIFKDGAFKTYQKAKLINVHLVSVLWLDATRRHSCRVPEKNYPAFGRNVCDENVSILCSQLQKDYEDVIKDEKKRRKTSYLTNPLPNLDARNRRRTVMSQSSTSTYVTANKSSAEEDTSGDSDCGVVDGETSSKRSRLKSFASGASTRNKTSNVTTDMELTPRRSVKNILRENSMDSDRTRSDLLDKASPSKANKENCSLTTVGTTMSSLRLSDSLSKRNSTSSVTKRQAKKQSEEPAPNKKKGRKDLEEGSSRELESPSENDASEESEAENPKTSQTRRSRSRSLLGTTSNSNLTKTQPKKQTSVQTPSKRKTGKQLEDHVESPNKKGKITTNNKNVLEESESMKVPRSRRSCSATNLIKSQNKSPKERSENDSSDESESNKAPKSRKTRGRSISKKGKESTSESEGLKAATTSSSGGARSISTSRSESEDCSSKKKTRKLYNPNASYHLTPPELDQTEREEHRKQKAKKTRDDGVFLNPNQFLIAPLQSKTKPPIFEFPVLNSSDDDLEIVEEPKKKKKLVKKKAVAPRDSSADEQRELLEELTKKVATPRRSDRVSPNRRSSRYFQTEPQQARLKLDPKKTSSVVCTKMHRPEVVNFEKVVRELGTFMVQDKVTNKTTHLVAGESKRTINMLRAIARGCWVLTHDWLLRSNEEGKWLNEEDFEVVDFSPAVQECRLQRQAFGSKFTIDVFKDCGPIYLAKFTRPKASELRELILTCQGVVTTILRNAVIVVGEYIPNKEVKCVTETWVLDCITFNSKKPLKNYLIEAGTQHR